MSPVRPTRFRLVWLLALLLCLASPSWLIAEDSSFKIEINVWPGQTNRDDDDFVTWAPIGCRIRSLASDGEGTIPVVLTYRRSHARAGRIVFAEYGENWWDPAFQEMDNFLRLDVPADGTPVPFVIAGKFGSPSSRLDDVALSALHASRISFHSYSDGRTALRVLDAGPYDSEALTVRLRKDAKNLSPQERAALLRAVKAAKQSGDYALYANRHRASDHHICDGYLAYGRAWVCAVERLLQIHEPLASIPFISFSEDDQTSLNAVFNEDFFGKVTNEDLVFREVKYAADNPLYGSPELRRRSPTAAPQTLQRLSCEEAADTYYHYNIQEQDIFGNALSWKWGSLNRACNDQAFLTIIASVDREYARWQACKGRFKANQLSYSPTGTSDSPQALLFGHRAFDQIKFWQSGANLAFPRATNPLLPPGPHPIVVDMLNYCGRRTADDVNPAPVSSGLGYGYADIPYYTEHDSGN